MTDSLVETQPDGTTLLRLFEALGAAGADVPERLLTALGTVLDADLVLIGRLDAASATITVTAMWDRQSAAGPLTYRVDGGPCAQVAGGMTVVHPDAVRSVYPASTLLQRGDMAAYAGAPLVDADGTVFGVLAVLSRRAFADPALVRAALGVFAARAAATLGRGTVEARLTEANSALRQALAARAASEARLRDFADASSDWFWEQDAELRFTYFSEGLRLVTGIDSSRLIGKTREMLRDDGTLQRDPESWAALAATVARRAPFRDFTYPQRSPDGRMLQLSISGIPVFDESGTFRGYRGTGRDITALHEARARAAKTKQRLRDGIEAMPAGFALFDAQDRLVIANSPYVNALAAIGLGPPEPGLTFETLIRRVEQSGHFGSFDTETDREAFIQARLERHRNPDETPIEQLTPGPRWHEVRERRTAEGGTVLIRTDVTDRKLSELRLRDAIECLPVGFIMLDSADRLVLCNRRYRALYPDAAPVMVPGTPFIDIVAAASGQDGAPLSCAEDAMDRVRAADGSARQHLSSSGHHVLTSLTRTADGGTVGVFVDITAMVVLQEQLADATRRAEEALAVRTRFLANMSHELRTPLNAVIGFSELMLMETQGPILPKYREFAGIIKQSGEFLLGLIVDILDIAKIEAGKMTVSREPVDLGAIAREVEARLSLAAARKGLWLRVETPAEPTIIQGDRLRLLQIVQNLVSNAVKFTGAGGVLVRIAQREGTWAVTVADTGRGMTADDIAYAMEPFQQRRGGDSREVSEGTGLGLPLVRALTELHGGRFLIDSRPGEGTVATVLLPAG